MIKVLHAFSMTSGKAGCANVVFVDCDTPAMSQRRKMEAPKPPRTLGERLGWICGSVVFAFLVGDTLRGGPIELAVTGNMLAAAIAGLAVLQSFMLLRHHYTVVNIAAFGLIAGGTVVFALVAMDIVELHFRLHPGGPRFLQWLENLSVDSSSKTASYGIVLSGLVVFPMPLRRRTRSPEN